ncbi:sodium-coupled monocarboxylate transporter 1-like [Frankliniella occidentalis]|uniref:Sodium-coupled monocarboxylate transporter 1-like n=1 Tax=Frankliniella occidentalis TaxID=133901 RepID=A0A9C6TVF4_FRAOC|nr:sodium-coupled monocarboxylate transporter 1-like [Frankliniella occidentalis]
MADTAASAPSAPSALGLASAPSGHPTDGDLHFAVADYAMFGLMMCISALVGVYYGFYKRQDTVQDYLLGGKSMGIFPIAMSLVASNVSGITMLGVPAEMYTYGSQYAALNLSAVLVCVAVVRWFVPVFFKLQFTSSYEYLEHRFNRSVRRIASFLFGLGLLLYLPVVIYVPCLAFNQVSGIALHIIAPAVMLICIFYTTVGGLKAVVWTDTLQLVVLVAASFVVITMGILMVGGMGEFIHRADSGGRLVFFDMNPDPLTRTTFWTVFVGSIPDIASSHAVHPTALQRFLSVPTLRSAQWAAVILCAGYILTKGLSCVTGLLVFATYHECDPLKTRSIKKPDQLVPFFVMDVARSVPGLAGLFVAGVFSAALSTMSSGLNTLAGTIYEDFLVHGLARRDRAPTEFQASLIIKGLALIVGVLCMALMFVVERLGSVLQVTYTLSGITGGAQLGLFVLGLFVPWANVKGAMAGGLCSLLFMGWIVTGSQAAIFSKQLTYPWLPTRVDGCANNVTDILHDKDMTWTNSITEMHTNPEDTFVLYRISYYYYTLLGALIVVVVGLVVSLFTGPQDLRTINRDLLSPAIYGFLPKPAEKASSREKSTKVAKV